MQSVPFFLRGAFRGAVRVSLQAILRGSCALRGDGSSSCCSPVSCCSDGKIPRILEERFQLFQEGRWLELLFFCRETERQVHQSSADAAAVRSKTMEFRGAKTGHKSGAFGRVVCSTSSPGRCQRCTGNDGHIERTDKPGSSSACGKTCTEPRDLAIRTSGGSSIGWGGFPHVSEDRQKKSCGRSVRHDC